MAKTKAEQDKFAESLEDDETKENKADKKNANCMSATFVETLSFMK